MSARDRYQVAVKDQRAAEFRHVSAQRDLQRFTAMRTIQRCLAARDRNTPGTFAHDVVALLAVDHTLPS